MVETQNKYFAYPGAELWDDGAKSVIPALPLMKYVSKVNNDSFKIPAKPEGERRTDGNYNPKAFMLIRDEFLQMLKDRKLTFYVMGMSEMAYFTIAPEEHMTSEKMYDDEIDTLVVMATCDISDPNYAMYAMEQYKDYIEMAAKERVILHFGMYRGYDETGRVLNTIRESLVIHHFNFHRMYLDVSNILKAGKHLADVEGLELPGFPNADDAVVEFGALKIPSVNISGLWTRNRRTPTLQSHGRFHNMGFNHEQYVRSMIGRRRVIATQFFEEFDRVDDPRVKEKVASIGAVMDIHKTAGEQWITMVPKQAIETGKKVPIVAYFGEVNEFDPAGALDELTTTFAFTERAAQGDFVFLIFALEDVNSNDLMEKLIREAAELYPVDLTRVYIAGHSHNGRFTAEFTRRHQDLVAAAAPLGNEPGQLSPEWTSGFFAITDEQLQKQASVDTPIAMINGFNEINAMYPLYTDAPLPNPSTPFIALDKKEKRVKSWQRRLISMNCPMKTEEEIYATQNSTDYVERTLGIPADRTDVLFIDGREVYIADIKNNNGDYHFRVCALGNAPHESSPEYAELMWQFCRRFARNQETGETIELYSIK